MFATRLEGAQFPLSRLIIAAPVNNFRCASSRITRAVKSSIFNCCDFIASDCRLSLSSSFTIEVSAPQILSVTPTSARLALSNAG